MRLSEQIHEIIERAKSLKKQCINSDKTDDFEIDDGPVIIKYPKQIKAGKEQIDNYFAFKKYLETFDRNTLLKIEALMYSGGKDTPYQSEHDRLKKLNETTEQIAKAIAGKISRLQLYLGNAMNTLKQEGIDVDKL